MEHGPSMDPNRRRRLGLALGAGLLLAALVGGAAALGGGSDDAAAAPAECVEAWNSDPDAVAYGRHNFSPGHDYVEARVGYLTPTGEPAETDGLCAVTFPSLTLDPEPVAAGQLLKNGRWSPISQQPGVELTRVAELQAEAAAAENAILSDAGVLAAQ